MGFGDKNAYYLKCALGKNHAYYLKLTLGRKYAYYLKLALVRKKRILPQIGFGGEAGGPSWGTKLGDHGPPAPSRASATSGITPLKNPLGPQLRVLAVWGIKPV